MKLPTDAIDALIRRREGPLTQELVREPGRFGLGQIPKRIAPDATTTMVCGFCSTGCGLKVHLQDGRAVNLTPETNYPVNLGMACPKGWEALTPLAASDRATTPLLRKEKGAVLVPTDWELAMTFFCDRLRGIQAEHGPESCAFLSSGQIATEEMALLGALWKFGMGFTHCDSNTRQCMATAHTAYKESFGFDAPPFTYADFEESDVLVFVGANPCIAHPIMWQRVMRNRNAPEIIVVDPRRTETAMAATQHYAIQPKSDLTLLYGLAHLLAKRGAIDREFIDAHTAGYTEFADFVAEFSPELVCAETGLSAEELENFAQTIAAGKRVSFWWTMGVNQGHESTRTAQALINLALMTGNIGRPGTGANSITGQCNAMGSRLFSNITGLLAGHDATNDAHRAKVAGILGINESVIPRLPSLAYDQIIAGIREGRIRALWVIGTNPSHSWVQQRELNELLDRLDFLVVQDMYANTESAQRADLILPAAGWGEKEGTFINSERRIGLIKKVCAAPGVALADFHIFKLIAHYWGCGSMFARWASPEASFQLLGALSSQQPCDISGITSYQQIDQAGGIQWPHPAGAEPPQQERRLFADGQFFHTDRRARFLHSPPQAAPELPDAAFPFLLLTGRGSSAQWHTGSRTEKSDVLRTLAPRETAASIHPEDAAALGLATMDWVKVISPRGAVVVRVLVSPVVQRGQVFLPMHGAIVNQLTPAIFDPHSRQPSYKCTAVALSKAAK